MVYYLNYKLSELFPRHYKTKLFKRLGNYDYIDLSNEEKLINNEGGPILNSRF